MSRDWINTQEATDRQEDSGTSTEDILLTSIWKLFFVRLTTSTAPLKDQGRIEELKSRGPSREKCDGCNPQNPGVLAAMLDIPDALLCGADFRETRLAYPACSLIALIPLRPPLKTYQDNFLLTRRYIALSAS